MAATLTKQADDTETNDAIIYIMPQRIQKSMLQDIKNGVKRTNLCVSEKYGETVTHIVTQYTDREQVLRQLKRDGAGLRDEEGDNLAGVKVVSLAWLSACLKAGKVINVEDRHLIKCSNGQQGRQGTNQAQGPGQGRSAQPAFPAWACQRCTPLKHFNQRFTDALETLEKHAEFRNDSNDYSRALAFRRASCVLKSLPYRVVRLAQVEGLKDVGEHALKVIQSILEDGVCEEVQQVTNEWFLLMKEFTSVFGVGPATAKKWIDKGWNSIDEVRESHGFSKDERVIWGLAFHEDLTSPVALTEADRFVQIVKTEAEKILPGVIVTLTGGFRRGKQSGHDVDILMTHREEGQEMGLLPALLQSLHRKGLVLMGRLESSTYTPDCLASDSKLMPLRGQLDHFEKWLGICRFEPEEQLTTSSRRCASIAAGTSSKDPGMTVDVTSKWSTDPDSGTVGNVHSKQSTDPDSDTHSTDSSPLKHGHPPRNEDQGTSPDVHADVHIQAVCIQGSDPPGKRTGKHKHGDDSSASERKLKQQKTYDTPHSPFELAKSERAWKARRMDLIVSPFSQYYYALVGWTGNKHFNRDLRTYTQKELHMKLTSHGLWDFEKKREVPARSEAEVFSNLKLDHREPSDRNC
ncbi:hypothetical protein ACOMHN_022641 [Nucella lapillus]